MKVFIKRKFLSVETILGTYTHTNTHTDARTHEHTDYTKFNVTHNLKRAANRLETGEESRKTANMAIDLGKEMF